MIKHGHIASLFPIMFKVQKNKEYLYCTCGFSKKQPMCDGSHKSSDFKPLCFSCNFTINEALCACKHTRVPPYCDGEHSKL